MARGRFGWQGMARDGKGTFCLPPHPKICILDIFDYCLVYNSIPLLFPTTQVIGMLFEQMVWFQKGYVMPYH
ncbi:MAG TPA: hypothetical protein VN611_15780 [Patescibacteria group bacterium]|nr:hypothetical protein [Patescibacteria group bacterium]